MIIFDNFDNFFTIFHSYLFTLIIYINVIPLIYEYNDYYTFIHFSINKFIIIVCKK